MKKKQRKVRLIRTAIQLIFFIAAPSLFSTAFAGIKSIFLAIGGQQSVTWNSFLDITALLLIITILQDIHVFSFFLHNRILFQITGNESMGCILHAYNRQTAEIYLHCGNSSADPDYGRNVYTGAFLLPVSLSYGSSICNYAGYTGSTFQTKSSKLCAKVHSL